MIRRVVVLASLALAAVRQDRRAGAGVDGGDELAGAALCRRLGTKVGEALETRQSRSAGCTAAGTST
jgi:hypothetical protein